MKKRVKFSIITVTYNSEKVLEKTILSVINQSCKDYEYIIIDGNSTDNTVAIIRQYEKHLTSWLSETDNGIYDAMNKGIRLASGRWIIFMNSGDEFADSNVLQSVVDATLNDDKSDILYGDIGVRRGDELVLRTSIPPCNKQRMHFCHQAAFTKTILMKEMLFDTRYKMSADLHFFKRCFHGGKCFRYLGAPIAVFDTNGVSNTNRLQGLLENVRVVRALDDFPQKFLFLFRLYFIITRIRLQNLFRR